MLVVFVDLNSLSVSLTDASRLSSIVVLDSESAFVSPWLFWLTNENLYWLSPDNQKPKRQTAMRSRLSTVANFTHITARPKEMKWNDNNCSATYENVLSLIGFFSFLVFGLWKRHRVADKITNKHRPPKKKNRQNAKISGWLMSAKYLISCVFPGSKEKTFLLTRFKAE